MISTSSPEVMELIDNGGYAVKKDGKIIAAHNLHQMFVPASIVKIATSLAALHILGPQFRFETYFFMDMNQNLYIKGFGDPFLISEEIELIVRELKKQGVIYEPFYLSQEEFDDIINDTNGNGHRWERIRNLIENFLKKCNDTYKKFRNRR